MSNKKKRGKKHHDEHMDESWLIPYADLLTLLLALFIVLFAASNVNAEKFKEISQSFQSVFDGGTGVLESPSPVPPEEESPEEKPPIPPKENENTGKEKPSHSEVLQGVNKDFQNYIKDAKLQGKLKTRFTDEGLLITLLDDVLFQSGKADIERREEKIAKEISNFLVTNPPLSIIISGHTDNVPISTTEFPSNWHLSTKRSVNFLEVILQNKRLKPGKFSAKGYGEYKPLFSNNTAKNRSKNRRIELLILPPGKNDYNAN